MHLSISSIRNQMCNFAKKNFFYILFLSSFLNSCIALKIILSVHLIHFLLLNVKKKYLKNILLFYIKE